MLLQRLWVDGLFVDRAANRVFYHSKLGVWEASSQRVSPLAWGFRPVSAVPGLEHDADLGEVIALEKPYKVRHVLRKHPLSCQERRIVYATPSRLQAG
jgi:hypothetical protein